MVSVLKNEEGYVIAYSEWWVCNVNGHIQDKGEYCQVRELWIHPKHRNKGTIYKMIKLIDQGEFMENVKWVYWNRSKYDRLSRLIPRDKIAKKGV